MSIPASSSSGSTHRTNGDASLLSAAPPDSPAFGTQAPGVPQTTRRVEGSIISDPQPGAFDLFGVLEQSVGELVQAQRSTKAAAVSLRMRQIAPEFHLDRTDYVSFKQLLEAAAAEGVVTLERADSDIVVRLPGEVDPGAIDRLSNDLWSAFIRWGDESYRFDRTTARTTAGLVEDEEHQVAVHRISARDQTEWMRAFIAELDDVTAAERLTAALGEPDAARGFLRETRSLPPIAAKWKRHLKERVIATAVNWAVANDIPLKDLNRPGSHRPRAGAQVPGGTSEVDTDTLRADIFAILERMPLHELLRLPIPLEYTLGP